MLIVHNSPFRLFSSLIAGGLANGFQSGQCRWEPDSVDLPTQLDKIYFHIVSDLSCMRSSECDDFYHGSKPTVAVGTTVPAPEPRSCAC